MCIFHKQSRSKYVQTFKDQLFCDVEIVCSKNVFFINNLDPKLRLKSDTEKKIF